MPEMMRAVVIHGPHDLRVEEIPKPVPGPGQVVCRVAAAGICGSDIEIYHGTMPYFEMGLLSFPWTPGHEWSGVVDSVGAGVTHLKAGDRIVGECNIACGRCESCFVGNYHTCDNRTEVGVAGDLPGGFADFILMPAAQTLKVPDSVSLREAAMTEPTGVTMHGLDHLSIRPGRQAVVMGDGTIGLLAAQMARASGASVVLLGSHEFKMDIARKIGIAEVVNRHSPTAREEILDALGGKKADYLIEATGNPKTLDFASSLIRMSGKCLIISYYPVQQVTFNLNNFIANEIHIYSTFSGVNCFGRVLHMMESKQIHTLPLQGPYYSFDQVKQAFEDVAHKKTSGVKTLVVHEDILD